MLIKAIMSSANIMAFNILEKDGRSLTATRKSSGTRMEPCGTPHVAFCKSLLLSLVI